MTGRKEEARVLPVWAKLLIGVVVVTMAGSFAFGLAVILEVKKVGTRMVDAKAITAAAQRIAAFPDPLPPGFHYVIGMDLAPLELAIVTIQHEPDKQLFTFSCVQGTVRGDAKELLDYGYSVGLNMLTTNARFTDVEKRGSIKLGSNEMPYILGHVQDIGHENGEGLVGCLQIGKERTKNILIYALQTGKTPYNQQITMDLLNSIKSF